MPYGRSPARRTGPGPVRGGLRAALGACLCAAVLVFGFGQGLAASPFGFVMVTKHLGSSQCTFTIISQVFSIST